MQKTLKPAERLIVAVDFESGVIIDDLYGFQATIPERTSVTRQVMDLLRRLRGTGVCIKVNSILRACGYDLICEIHSLGFKVFADLELVDIPNTLRHDGILLREVNPDFLTVMCIAGVPAMRALKDELPDTEVLGVTVLSSCDEERSQDVFGGPILLAVESFACEARNAGLDGVVCAPQEVMYLRQRFEESLSLIVAGIRPSGTMVYEDDRNPARTMTPAEAIRAGADRIIVGRPIVRARSPYDATMRIIEEIAEAVS